MKHLFKLFCLSIFFITACNNAQQDSDIFEQFESKFYDIDGYQINVEMKGTGDPIFFLPGGPGNSHDYMQGNFGQYYKTNTVVFFDWLGRGKSDDAKDASEYSVENDVELIEKLRVLLKFNKISLVGHSYGTVPAQAYAIKYKDNVDKMVLINGFHSGAMWQANCDSYNHYAKTHFPIKWKKVDSLRALGYVSSDKELADVYGDFPTKYIYYHDTKLKQNAPKAKHRSWANDVYVAIIGKDGDFDVSGSMINQDYRKALKTIKAKTLVVAGRYDGVSTPEFAVQYKTFMPQAQFEMFENSGHNPYLEEPETFLEFLTPLLNEQNSIQTKSTNHEIHFRIGFFRFRNNLVSSRKPLWHANVWYVRILFHTDGTEIDLTAKTYRNFTSLFGYRIGTCKNLPEIEYVSVFSTSETTTLRSLGAQTSVKSDIIQLNLFHNRNQKITAYNTTDKEDAFKIANEIAQILNIDILDATEAESKWL